MTHPETRLRRDQAGGGILSIIAVMGLALILIQGTVYYKSKGSAKFLGSEKNKVLAQQLAEAGVEENIADLGKRTVRIRPGLADSITYADKSLGNGTFTTRLTTVATGPASDTIDLVSTGTVGRNSQSIAARMKVRKVMDTTRTPIVTVTPFDSVWYETVTVPITTTTTQPADIAAIPDMNTTQAYKDCISGGGKCNVCHIPPGNPANVHVISISSNAVKTHVSHHGDYIAAKSDIECDLYKPKTVTTTTYQTNTIEHHVMVDHTTYDTTVSIDTSAKVQILSWR